MASKGNNKVKKRTVVKKDSSPYAPMLKLAYRSLIGFGILVVAWMAYEIFNTARVGMKQYDRQQREYNEARGISKQPEKPAQEEKTDEETPEQEDTGN